MCIIFIAPSYILCFNRKEETAMTAISKEYLLLFNTLTDTERALSQLRESLLEAQRQAEELFLEKDPAESPPEAS